MALCLSNMDCFSRAHIFTGSSLSTLPGNTLRTTPRTRGKAAGMRSSHLPHYKAKTHPPVNSNHNGKTHQFKFKTCRQWAEGCFAHKMSVGHAHTPRPRGSYDDLISHRCPLLTLLRILCRQRDVPAFGLPQAPGGLFLYFIHGLVSFWRCD